MTLPPFGMSQGMRIAGVLTSAQESAKMCTDGVSPLEDQRPRRKEVGGCAKASLQHQSLPFQQGWKRGRDSHLHVHSPAKCKALRTSCVYEYLWPASLLFSQDFLVIIMLFLKITTCGMSHRKVRAWESHQSQFPYAEM